MNFGFYWIKDQSLIYASPTFQKEARRFLTVLFKQTVFKYFDKRLLCYQNEGLPSLQADDKTMLYEEVSIKLTRISGLLFTFQLGYYSKNGSIINPYDLVEKDSLEFHVKNYPNEQKLIEIQDSWSEVIKDVCQFG